jgi:hypothetical protein
MRDSQYLTDYIATNALRGIGRGLTVNTYLAYTLRGRAKRFGDVYRSALVRSIQRAIGRGEVAEGPSARGAIAYYPAVAHPAVAA